MYCKNFKQNTSQKKNFNSLFFLVINILESHYNEIEKTNFKKEVMIKNIKGLKAPFISIPSCYLLPEEQLQTYFILTIIVKILKNTSDIQSRTQTQITANSKIWVLYHLFLFQSSFNGSAKVMISRNLPVDKISFFIFYFLHKK